MHNIFFTFIIYFLGVFCNLQAADISLGNGVTISDEELKKIESQLPKTPEETTFYHWTKRNVGLRWINQTNIDAGEVSFYNTPTGNRQVYGAGIYIATSPTSSEEFGVIPVTVKIKKGTPIYDPKIVQEITGKNLTNAQASVLGEKIPFIRSINGDWYVTNHSANTTEIGYGYNSSPNARIKGDTPDQKWDVFSVVDDISDAAINDPEAIRLKKLVALSDYMDGISFARALKVNPTNPWNEFEPEHFESYQHALINLKKENVHSDSGDRWQTQTAKQDFTKIFKAISGNSSAESFDLILRKEGIRAGGDEEGKTFFISEKELKPLQDNPYIEVNIKKHSSEGYLVEYFYPDAFHYKKLKGKISDSLYQTLENSNQELLMKDVSTRQKLNTQIITELLDDAFKHYQGTSISLDEPSIRYMRDLISIHPFSDFNGRSIRMYFKLALAQKNKSVPYFMMSDMDLLMPPAEQVNYLRQAIAPHQELQRGLIEEFALAKGQKRAPDYLKAIDFNKFVSSGFSDIASIDLNAPEELEMIKKREWTKLSDKAAYKGWDELEKQLADPAQRKEALLKLYSFNPNVGQGYSEKTREKVFSILYKEMMSDPEIGEHGINCFKKYEAMYKVKATETLPPPLKIKEDFTTKICGSLSCFTSSVDTKKRGIQFLRLLEEDDITLIEHYLNGPLKDSNQEVAGSALKMYNSIVETYQKNPSLFKNLPEDKKRKFIKLLTDAADVFAKNHNEDSSIYSINYTSSVINDITTEEERVRHLDQMKSDLRLMHDHPAWNIRQKVLFSYMNLLNDDNDKFKFLTLGFLDDSDNDIKNAANRFYNEMRAKYVKDPNLFKQLSSDKQKDMLLSFQKIGETALYKKELALSADALGNYKVFYGHTSSEAKKTLSSPEIILSNAKKQFFQLAADPGWNIRRDVVLFFPSIASDNSEYLKLLSMGSLVDSDNDVRNAAYRRYKEMGLEYKTDPILFKQLSPDKQKDMLLSFQKIGDMGLDKKDLYLSSNAFENYKALYQFTSPEAQKALTSPEIILSNMKKQFFQLAADPDWNIRRDVLLSFPSIASDDAEKLKLLSMGSLVDNDGDVRNSANRLYNEISEKYKRDPNLFKQLSPDKQKDRLLSFQKIGDILLDKKNLYLSSNAFENYKALYELKSPEAQKALTSPEIILSNMKKQFFQLAADPAWNIRSDVVLSFPSIASDDAEKLKLLSMGPLVDNDGDVRNSANRLYNEISEKYKKDPNLFKQLSPDKQNEILLHLKTIDEAQVTKGFKPASTYNEDFKALISMTKNQCQNLFLKLSN